MFEIATILTTITSTWTGSELSTTIIPAGPCGSVTMIVGDIVATLMTSLAFTWIGFLVIYDRFYLS